MKKIVLLSSVAERALTTNGCALDDARRAAEPRNALAALKGAYTSPVLSVAR